MNNSDAGASTSTSPFTGRRGLAYSRVSSSGQRADAQELRCKSYLEAANVPFERNFTDTYTGGGDFMNRPAMRELLAYIDAAPHLRFVVVFDDLKRFARDVEFHIKLRREFQSRDVVLACLNYNFDDSPEGEFIERVLAAQNELERKQNRRQVIQKMSARLARGYWTFNRKFGYRRILDPRHGKIFVPDATGALLREALVGFASGRFVRRIDVYRFLLGRGCWKGRSPDKYYDRVDALLQDPFYCGDIEYLPWGIDRRAGQHEPLISRKAFEQIQARLVGLEAGASLRRDVRDDFPLRGLLLCDACHRPLTGSYSRARNGDRHPYYHCFNQKCALKGRTLRRADVEREFKELLADAACPPLLLPVLDLAFERACELEVITLSRRWKTCKAEEARLRTAIANVVERAATTPSQSVREAYEVEIERLSAALRALDQMPEKPDLGLPVRTASKLVNRLFNQPLETWNRLNTIEQRRLFTFLFQGGVPYSRTKGLRTAKQQSYAWQFQRLVTSQLRSVDPASETPNRGRPCAQDEQLAELSQYLTRFWAHLQTSPDLQRVLEARPKPSRSGADNHPS